MEMEATDGRDGTVPRIGDMEYQLIKSTRFFLTMESFPLPQNKRGAFLSLLFLGKSFYDLLN
jgi:hypothetical protein